MSDDSVIRLAAVVAAVALLAAPYRQQVMAWITTAAEAAKANGALASRLAAAALLIAAAWGKIQLPSMPTAPAVTVVVETPSVEMQQLVRPVADAMNSVPMGDRMLWAQTWSKAATVVAGDAVTTEVVFSDTRSLRLFTTLALDIAWRRIGQHQPGEIPGLRDAVEEAYNTATGRDVVPVDAAVRQRFCDFAKAVAWAGMNGG